MQTSINTTLISAFNNLSNLCCSVINLSIAFVKGELNQEGLPYEHLH